MVGDLAFSLKARSAPNLGDARGLNAPCPEEMGEVGEISVSEPTMQPSYELKLVVEGVYAERG
jgi:hypothetical protein